MPLERLLSSSVKEISEITAIHITMGDDPHVSIEYKEAVIDGDTDRPKDVFKRCVIAGSDFNVLYVKATNDGENVGSAVKRICYEWIRDKKHAGVIDKVIKIQCTSGSASAATVSVSATALTTTVTGDAGTPDLNVLFATFKSLKAVVDEINTKTNYTASIVGSQYMASKELVSATDQDIKGVDYEADGPSTSIV